MPVFIEEGYVAISPPSAVFCPPSNSLKRIL
jgi:hypothetical protein